MITLPYLVQLISKKLIPGFYSSKVIGAEYPSTISNFLILILSYLSTIMRYGKDDLNAPGCNLIVFKLIKEGKTGTFYDPVKFFLATRLTLRH